MGQVKAKTMIEKAGFRDDDLKTPEHDSIMLWLDQNIYEVVNNAFPSVWTETEINYELSDLRSEFNKCRSRIEGQISDLKNSIKRIDDAKAKKSSLNITWNQTFDEDRANFETKITEAESKLVKLEEWLQLDSPPVKPKCEVISTHWEYTIVNDRSFVVGFVDMMVRIRRPGLSIQTHISNMHPFPTAKPQWKTGNYSDEIYIEVKSKITSLGELIRQIRFYQSHKKGMYVVVSPDGQFAEVLKSQGIGFVACPSFSTGKPTQGKLF